MVSCPYLKDLYIGIKNNIFCRVTHGECVAAFYVIEMADASVRKKQAMKMYHLLFFVLLLCTANLISAQQANIKGRVLDDSGRPLKGVMLLVKRREVVATTNDDGAFAAAIPKIPDTLVFVIAGYNRVEIKVTEKSRIKRFEVVHHLSYSPQIAADMVTVVSKKESIATVALAATPLSGYLHLKRAGLAAETLGSIVARPAPRLSNTGRSQILTAGELCDFKKWKLWEDYAISDFDALSRHWGLSPRKRYCVQVQNEEHYPIVGERLYLLVPGTRDTVWQAITDNTGKAELWGDAFCNETNAHYWIASKNGLVTSPTEFRNGINQITVKKSCTVPGFVDLAFVVDATGSMADEIHYLQQELQDLIATTTTRYPDINLRSAAVFYRDLSDEYITRHTDLKTDPRELVQFINQQTAAGGGDFPEAVEDALAIAVDSLDWNSAARSKILFLVLDAPPHDEAKDKIRLLVLKAAKKSIRIVPVVCSGVDKSTEFLMRSIALLTNGSYVFLTDDSGVGNAHIKPTTDEFKVELLNDLLQRLIGEMIYVPICGQGKPAEPVKSLVSLVKISVYPNPSHGLVNIEAREAIKDIVITDFTGKVLFRPAPLSKKGRLQMDLSNYPSGTYLIKYFVESRGWGSEKFLMFH